MTNSQKYFQELMNELADFDGCIESFEKGVAHANALWERKLDEKQIHARIVSCLRLAIKANGPITDESNLFASAQHTARAIIEYMRGK